MPQYKLHNIHCNGWNHKVHLTHVSCVTIFWVRKNMSYVMMVLELTMFSMLQVTNTNYLNFKLDLQSITPLKSAWTSSFFTPHSIFHCLSNMFFKLQMTFGCFHILAPSPLWGEVDAWLSFDGSLSSSIEITTWFKGVKCWRTHGIQDRS
jgi:hypothetical protein